MTCIFKFVLFYRTRCRMPAKVLWALRSVCPFNNLTPLSVPKRQNQITLKGLKCNGRWKAKELVYVNFYVLQNPLPYVNLHVLKDSLLYEGRVWLWPYKVMFWGMQMTTLITNREGASEKSHTHAPPRTNAQRIRIKRNWPDYTERLKYQSFCIAELGLPICQLSTACLGYPSILHLYCNCILTANIRRCLNKPSCLIILNNVW